MLTEQQTEEAVEVRSRHKTLKAAAKELGIPPTTLANRLKTSNANDISKGLQCPLDSTTKFQVEEKSESAIVVSVDRKISTPEDALKRAKIDTSLWEIEKQIVNSWPIAMKNNDGKPQYVEMWQVKLWLRRKAPKHVQEGIKAFLKPITKSARRTPKPRVKKTANGHLLEVSLYDSHFGKYCWEPETGTDFDTDIAESIYANAVSDLLHRSSSHKIERIMFPVGNDFFQVNNWQNTTQRGTPVDHDGRFPRVFETGLRATVNAINRCLEVAPVDVVYVGGNHDMETSFYLCQVLKAHYKNNKHVTIDVSPKTRKAYVYGENLLLLDHGDKIKHKDYVGLCAMEFPQEWANARWREAHVGHLHKKFEMSTVDVNENLGFRVRILPSLSGTDKWHYENGFVKNHRCAEAYLWHKTDWYVGHYSVNARR